MSASEGRAEIFWSVGALLLMTQMYGPAVRCKGISMRRWQAVLHQCIRPLIGASCSGLIMDISAPAFSLADRPQRTIWVTRFRMRREDRTSISFSSSRRPWRINGLLALHGSKLAGLEDATASQHAPCDACELVGERDGQHVAVQPLLGRLDPMLKPMTLPALWLDQHHPGSLHEQNAQIAIA